MNAYRERKKAGVADVKVTGRRSRYAIKKALARGMTQEQIRRSAGIGRSTMYGLVRSNDPIRSSVEDKILAALNNDEKQKLPPRVTISNKKARQLVLSMAAQGWSKQHQRDILEKNRGVSGGFIISMTAKKYTKTLVEYEAHIRWLARAIGNQTGPSRNAMINSRRLGYFPMQHYNIDGDLIESTLSAEQLEYVKRVP